MIHLTREQPGYLIAERQPFSQSLLWALQQNYFARQGVAAWREGIVPHYVTSNPTMAQTYAELVLALWRDQQRLNSQTETEPLYLCELGAGSGRFAFHFLKQLAHLCEQADVPPTAFCYVLTDVADSNLDFWRAHPRLQPYFESGLLDLAQFDVNHSTELHLERRGEVIGPGSLNQPLVVIANYLFDSIPQDLFYFKEGRGYQALITLTADQDPTTLRPEQIISHLSYDYAYQELTEAPYPEPYLQALIAAYQGCLTETHLLFPAAGLRCLHRLRSLSRPGLILLSADKGQHRLSALAGSGPPRLMPHGGCFSLNVNYHALKLFCEQSGGIPLFPDHPHTSICVGALLLLDQAGEYVETQRAYQRLVQEFGPDDFYRITRHAKETFPAMSTADILAYLRLTRNDAHQFSRYLPRLLELVSSFTPNEHQALLVAVEQVWDLYFPLGEDQDLAAGIALLLFEMGEYTQALTYFERSLEIYGERPGTLCNMAMCYQWLDQPEVAEQLLHRVLQADPANPLARHLLGEEEENPPSRIMDGVLTMGAAPYRPEVVLRREGYAS
jgi:tetratricopeptide (TPR) repeat protein